MIMKSYSDRVYLLVEQYIALPYGNKLARSSLYLFSDQ